MIFFPYITRNTRCVCVYIEVLPHAENSGEAVVDIIYFAIAAVTVPVLFFMLTWAVVTAYRLLFPEVRRPPKKNPVVVRKIITARGTHVPVGTREIREDQRHYYTEHPPAHYTYAYGESDGFPEKWDEDLLRRQN